MHTGLGVGCTVHEWWVIGSRHVYVYVVMYIGWKGAILYFILCVQWIKMTFANFSLGWLNALRMLHHGWSLCMCGCAPSLLEDICFLFTPPAAHLTLLHYHIDVCYWLQMNGEDLPFAPPKGKNDLYIVPTGIRPIMRRTAIEVCNDFMLHSVLHLSNSWCFIRVTDMHTSE